MITRDLAILGLAYRAGRCAPGEEPAGAAVRAQKARLLVTASDAAANTKRRADTFSRAGGVPHIGINATKAEIGGVFGRESLAILAVCDIGFAASFSAKLARGDPRFAPIAQKLAQQQQASRQRASEAAAHRRNVRTGKKGGTAHE